MRFPKIFIGMFSISAGFAIWAAAYGKNLVYLPGMETFRAPLPQYDFSGGTYGVLGQIGRLLNDVMFWLWSTPGLLSRVLGALGVPPVVAEALVIIAGISFVAWLVYMASGRILNP